MKDTRETTTPKLFLSNDNSQALSSLRAGPAGTNSSKGTDGEGINKIFASSNRSGSNNHVTCHSGRNRVNLTRDRYTENNEHSFASDPRQSLSGSTEQRQPSK